MRLPSRRDLSRAFEPCSPDSTQIPFVSSRIRTLLLLLFFNKTKFQKKKKKKKHHLFSFFGHTASNYKLFPSVCFSFPFCFPTKPYSKFQKKNSICYRFGRTASNYKLFSISSLSTPFPYFHPFLISLIFNFIAVSLLFRFPTYSPLTPTIPLLDAEDDDKTKMIKDGQTWAH